MDIETSDSSTDIRPFRIAVPDSDLHDLQTRLAGTRWPDSAPGMGWERGVPLDYLKDLAEYWRTGFDWRAQEKQLNTIPQFTTDFDGQTVHFLHARSPEPGAVPLLLTHGWPGSPVDFIRVIDALTDPAAHGGDPADAFHVVAPSIPGFGFSTPVREPGWNITRTGAAWAELMDRLGYRRYALQAGDLGAGVAGVLAARHPERVIGFHLNGPGPQPFGGPVKTEGLSGVELDRAERFNEFQAEGLGYLHLQASRPQTISYSLTDSPVGQLAWIVEKYREWTDPAKDLPEDAIDRDHLLTSVSVYWFTGSGASSARFIAESMHGGGAWEAQPTVPMGFAVYAGDHGIRSLFDPEGRIGYWAEYDTGGHFPAMEVPGRYVSDIRAFFRSLR